MFDFRIGPKVVTLGPIENCIAENKWFTLLQYKHMHLYQPMENPELKRQLLHWALQMRDAEAVLRYSWKNFRQ